MVKELKRKAVNVSLGSLWFVVILQHWAVTALVGLLTFSHHGIPWNRQSSRPVMHMIKLIIIQD